MNPTTKKNISGGMKEKHRISRKQFQSFLFGWLWIEDNVMIPARRKLKIGEFEKNKR